MDEINVLLSLQLHFYSDELLFAAPSAVKSSLNSEHDCKKRQQNRPKWSANITGTLMPVQHPGIRLCCNLIKILSLVLLNPQGAIRHVTPAVGLGHCPALPALPMPFFCLQVSVPPNAPLVTTTTATESVSVRYRNSYSLPLKPKKRCINLQCAV